MFIFFSEYEKTGKDQINLNRVEWVLGRCTPAGILQDTASEKLDLFPSQVIWVRATSSVEPVRNSVKHWTIHLSIATHINASEIRFRQQSVRT